MEASSKATIGTVSERMVMDGDPFDVCEESFCVTCGKTKVAEFVGIPSSHELGYGAMFLREGNLRIQSSYSSSGVGPDRVRFRSL